MELKDQVAIVTGASRGIGDSIARALAARGAKVVVTARSSGSGPGTVQGVAEKVAAAGGEALPLIADLGDDDQVLGIVEKTIDHYGRVDILINNAVTVGRTDMFSEIDVFRNSMNVDLFAPLLLTRAVVPHMRKVGGGRILNISSLVAITGAKGKMAYGMAKIAMERMTIDIAKQLKRDSIACNAFRIDLPVREQAQIDSGWSSETKSAEFEQYTEPAEVAAEGALWMVTQPQDYTGRIESMRFLREREGCMSYRAKKLFPMPYRITVGWPN